MSSFNVCGSLAEGNSSFCIARSPVQEDDLHLDVGSNYELHLDVWEGGHHL